MAVLKGLTISVAGTLKYDTTQIKKWVEANGGTYTPSMRKGLTHLVASKHAWRSASDAVQTAVDLQAWVVCWDWLEDSLQDHRKKAEKPYSWEFVEQQRKRSREIEKLGARADRKKFEDGCVEARRATGSGTSKSKSKPMSKPRPRASTRKKRESLTGYLVNDDLVKDIPFVSAAETLKRKRAEREAAKATKPTSRAPTPSSSSPNKAPSPTSPSPSAPSPPSHPLTTNAPPPPTQRAKRPSLKDLYHYYLDATGFEYKILLTRCDLHRNTMQRYQLSILESHTKPNVYCTFIQYYPAAAPNAADGNASGGANNVSGTSNSNSKSDNSATAGELGVMQAVLDFNASYPSTSTATSSSSSIIPPPYTGPQEHHPEAQRLRALTQDPTDPTTPAAASPPETLPYTALLTPLSTPYPTAHASFRHAFRDLTLLSWCERFSVGKALYKRRAEEYGVEPFVYLRPKGGMPVGAVVQIGVAEGGGNGGEGILCEGLGEGLCEGAGVLGEGLGLGEDEDEGERKVKYPFLPALHAPLGNGVIGSAVAADRREAERREADRRETDGREKASREAEEATHVPNPQRNPENPAKRRRPRYNRPLFNGLLGPPGPPGPPGQPTREREGGGFGTAKRQRKAWPCETGLL